MTATGLKIAYVLYDEFTMLDIVGPFNVFDVVPGVENVWVGEMLGVVSDQPLGGARPFCQLWRNCVRRASHAPR